MHILRRSAALTALMMSILGLLACLAGTAGVWAVKSRVDRAAAAVFTAADDAFEFMHTRLILVQQRLESGGGQVAGLAARAERLKTMPAGEEPVTGSAAAAEIESIRCTLDQVAIELRVAETWLDSIEAVARGVNAAAASIADARKAASSQPVSGPDDALRGVAAQRVAELANDLAQTVSRLDALRAKLLEMRENRLLAKELSAAVIAAAADLDMRLDTLAKRIGDFDGRVTTARAEFIDAGQRAHMWITFGSIGLTMALLWLGASQAYVLSRASRLLHAQR